MSLDSLRWDSCSHALCVSCEKYVCLRLEGDCPVGYKKFSRLVSKKSGTTIYLCDDPACEVEWRLGRTNERQRRRRPRVV